MKTGRRLRWGALQTERLVSEPHRVNSRDGKGPVWLSVAGEQRAVLFKDGGPGGQATL